jgi:hypothetical protein
MPAAKGAIKHVIDSIIDPWAENAADCINRDLLMWMTKNYLRSCDVGSRNIFECGDKLARSWAAKSTPMISKQVVDTMHRWRLCLPLYGLYHDYVFSLATPTTWDLCLTICADLASSTDHDTVYDYYNSPYMLIVSGVDRSEYGKSVYKNNVTIFALNINGLCGITYIDKLRRIFRAHALTNREGVLLTLAADLCKAGVSADLIESAARYYIKNKQFIRRCDEAVHACVVGGMEC